jgi:NDP-sugar pyrophosphorylase family protein
VPWCFCHMDQENVLQRTINSVRESLNLNSGFFLFSFDFFVYFSKNKKDVFTHNVFNKNEKKSNNSSFFYYDFIDRLFQFK